MGLNFQNPYIGPFKNAQYTKKDESQFQEFLWLQGDLTLMFDRKVSVMAKNVFLHFPLLNARIKYKQNKIVKSYLKDT